MVHENAEYVVDEPGLVVSARRLWNAQPPTQTEEFWQNECEKLRQQILEARSWSIERWAQERDHWYASEIAKADKIDRDSAPQRAEYERQLAELLQLLDDTTEGSQAYTDLNELVDWFATQLQTSEVALVHRPLRLSPRAFTIDRLARLSQNLRNAEYFLEQNQKDWAAFRSAQAKIAYLRNALNARPMP